MKRKNLISAILALAILMTSLMSVTVQAAAPLLRENEEQVAFSHNFLNATAESVAKDFTISGTEWMYDKVTEGYIYQYAENYNTNGKIQTIETYDLSKQNYWKFSVTASSNANGYYIYLGTGYAVKVYQKKLSLHEVNEAAVSSTALASVDISDIYGAKKTFNIVYNYGVLKVLDGTNERLTYDSVDQSKLVGTFAVQAASTDRLKLYEINLMVNTPVEYWLYEEEFVDETVASLNAKGWSFPSTPTFGVPTTGTNAGDDYIKVGTSTATYTPAGTTLRGNYRIKAKQYSDYNPQNMYMRLQAPDGSYYSIIPITSKGGTEAKIEKYDKSTEQTTAVNTTTTPKSDYVTYTYDVEVITEPGKTTVKADIYTGSPLALVSSLTYVDEVNPITEASVKLRASGGTDVRLYNFAAYSTIREEDKNSSVELNKPVFEKTFSASDTSATLKKDNISVDYFDSYKGYTNEYTVQEYVTFTDEYGMSLHAGGVFYKYDGSNSDYTFKANMYKQENNAFIRFNTSDDRTSYYCFDVQTKDTNRGFKLYKKTADGTTELATLSLDGNSPEDYSATGAHKYSDYYINCDYQADGSLKITVAFKAKECNEYLLTATDASPIVGTGIEMSLGDKGRIKSFSVLKPEEYYGANGDKPVFGVRFFDAAGNAINDLPDGKVYANVQAMLLNEEYMGLAAIYDGDRMLDAKIIKASDLHKTYVELFDVSNVENAEIKFFIWENFETLSPLTDSAVLNNNYIK